MRRFAASVMAVVGAGALAFAASSGVSSAQEFYLGTVFETGNGGLDTGGLSDSDADVSSLQAIAGARFSIGNLGFIGGEFEASLSGDYSESPVTFSELDQRQRIRALAGTRVGAATIFASVGQATYELGSGDGSDSLDGLSVGIGGEFEINDRFSIRAEAIHDMVESSVSDFQLETTSIRAGAVINF